MRLLVYGSYIELERTPIALTSQASDYFDPENRRVGYTNEFSIPPTPKNLKTLGFPGEWGSQSLLPYRQIPVQLIDGSIEITRNAVMQINSVDSNGMNVSIKDGTISFYDSIEGKNVSELDFTSLNHVLTPQSLVDSLTQTWQYGYIYGIADWGKHVDGLIEFDYQIPCLYKRWVFEKIISEAGFEFIAPLDYISEQVISPNVSFNSETDEIPPQIILETNGTFSRFRTNTYPDAIFEDKYELFPIVTNTLGIVNGDDIELNVAGYYSLNLFGFVNWSGQNLKIKVKKNGTTIKTYEFTDSQSSGLIDEPFYFYGNIGDVLNIYIECQSSYDLNQDTWRHSFSASFRTILKTDNSALNVNFSSLFDIGQTEFVKDVMQQLGLIVELRSDGVIEFKRVEDIILGDAVDLSDLKIKNSSNSFSIGSLTRTMRMGYNYVDELEPRWADAFLEIDDHKLENVESELFKSIYFVANKSENSISSVRLALSPYWDVSETEVNPIQTGPYTFQVIRIQSEISIGSSGGGDVLVYDGIFPYLDSYPIRMSNMLSYHYPQWNQVLNRPEVMEIEANQSAYDVVGVSFLKRYYHKKLGYFLVNSVSHSSGNSKMEIIRLR